MKRIIFTLITAIALSSILVSPAFALAIDDASTDDTLKNIENEIVNDFIPDYLLTDTQRPITREAFCATIISLYEYITKTSAELPDSNPFTDTDNSEVLKAYNLGIVKGMDNGIFNPLQILTVEQKAVMLYNMLIVLDPSIDNSITPVCDFTDADSISSWAVEAIEYLYHHNIITDDGDNKISPKNTLTVEKANEYAQNTLDHYNNLLVLKTSDDSPLVTNTAYNTVIETPDGFKAIEKLQIGDDILVANTSLNWSTAGISFSEGVPRTISQRMLFISFGNDSNKPKQLIVTSDQLFMTSDYKLVRANSLIAGKDNLIDKNGNPVKVLNVAYGQFNNGIHNISSDIKYNGSPDGHLLLANGVVIGDFTLQIYYSNNQQTMAE